MVAADMDDIVRDEDNPENIGLGSAHEMFVEVDEVLNIVENLKTTYSNMTAVERANERFLFILNQYQEQPHLLDPHLDDLLEKLIQIAREKDADMALKHKCFRYLYIITKVRGYKIVVRHLPHEVSDVEPVLALLEGQDPADSYTWETRYVLLLWLSIIVMIPFHMSRLDSFQPGQEDEGQKSVVTRILDLCKTYIQVPDTCMSAAAFMASRFLTRSDVKETHLAPFLEWASDRVLNEKSTFVMQCGALATVAAIFKHGKRGDLLPHASHMLKMMLSSKYKESPNSLVRKFGMKVIQRIGLTFLKVRIAKWRYQRGTRSLATNLSCGDSMEQRSSAQEGESAEGNDDEEDDIEVPDEIEEVVEELMHGLRDADTIIRWSAAKGIGRVTNRLPKELGDEVVESVLQLFTLREVDSAWHGGCLALAELGRRGLLLPQRLGEVVPVVLRALVYDEVKGNYSVGSHIRDAACYVCWAFARAYDANAISPYVNEISAALLVVSVFDREVNCRRAASAAFQENVGRQGTFPHGIDILTTADYFAVGSRSNAFLNVSSYIAQYEEYTYPLINHLLERKLDHWDSAIRELAAKALHNLTPKAPMYMADEVMKKLLARIQGIDLNARHGCILAVAEIIHSLAILAENSGSGIHKYIDEETLLEVRDLVQRLKDKQRFRGVGGDFMKHAVTVLIEKASLSHLPFHQEEVIDLWQSIINDCLTQTEANVRAYGLSALPAFLTEYCRTRDGVPIQDKKERIVAEYVAELSSCYQSNRMGFSLALGSFPKFMLEGQLHVIIPALVQCARITDTSEKWADCRRDAVTALTTICQTVGVQGSGPESDVINRQTLYKIFDCFLEGMKDYTLDSRGDIGAWVREASMTGVLNLVKLTVNNEPELLTVELMSRVVAKVAQQAVERIDRTRAHACRVFYSLIHNEPRIPNIPHCDELVEIFPVVDPKSINWSCESETFPKFTQLVAYKPYTYNVLLGLVVSIGGLTERLVKYSSSSLFSYLQSKHSDRAELDRLCNIFLIIFERYQKVDRVTLPLLKFLDQLLGSGCIRAILEDPECKFAGEILRLTKMEIARCGEPRKLMASADVFCQLIQVPGDVSRRSLTHLSIFLCHKFPRIRKSTASKLYESLTMFSDLEIFPEENLEDVMNILSDTNWDQPIEVIKPIRNKLCELLNVSVPKPLVAK